jgi:hypothetical protein
MLKVKKIKIRGMLLLTLFSFWIGSCDLKSNNKIYVSSEMDSVNMASLKRNLDTSGKNLNSINCFKVEDSLTSEEKAFIKKLQSENEFILFSNHVERLFLESKSSVPFATKLLISQDTLEKKGYFSFEFIFYGKITDVNVKYSYNLGQAAFGYGSVVGNDFDDYVHFLNSCGVTSCIVQGYHNGKKIFEKSE